MALCCVQGSVNASDINASLTNNNGESSAASYEMAAPTQGSNYTIEVIDCVGNTYTSGTLRAQSDPIAMSASLAHADGVETNFSASIDDTSQNMFIVNNMSKLKLTFEQGQDSYGVSTVLNTATLRGPTGINLDVLSKFSSNLNEEELSVNWFNSATALVDGIYQLTLNDSTTSKDLYFAYCASAISAADILDSNGATLSVIPVGAFSGTINLKSIKDNAGNQHYVPLASMTLKKQ